MRSDPQARSALDSAVPRILAEYPAPARPEGVVPLRMSGGFSGARIWRVEAAGNSFCLRAMPAQQVNLRRLSGLHRLLTYTAGRGIEQCPGPIARADRTTFSIRNEWVWQLERWMPGAADYRSNPSPARLRNALILLAHWHLAARAFVPAPHEAAWFSSYDSGFSPGLAERLARIEEFGPDVCDRLQAALDRHEWPEFDDAGLRILSGFRRAVPRVKRELELGCHVEVPLQPSLRDVWHDHLLFIGDLVTGLIDAHACRTESVAGDLARLLGSLVGDDRAAWDLGLSAYDRVRPLSLAERGLVELFDRSSVLLSGLTWLQWRYLKRREFDQPLAVLLRMQSLAKRLERLVASG